MSENQKSIVCEKPYFFTQTENTYWFMYWDKRGELQKIGCDEAEEILPDMFFLHKHNSTERHEVAFFSKKTKAVKSYPFCSSWEKYGRFIVVDGYFHLKVWDAAQGDFIPVGSLVIWTEEMIVPLFVDETKKTFLYPQLQENGGYVWQALSYVSFKLLTPKRDGVHVSEVAEIVGKDGKFVLNYDATLVTRGEADWYDFVLQLKTVE